MDICVVGAGCVGLVTAGCLAEAGNSVVCVDNDVEKMDKLRRGAIPIYEPDLAEIVKRNEEVGRLRFTRNLKLGTENSTIIFLTVGTPSAQDGSCDLSAVFAVADEIGGYLSDYRIIADRNLFGQNPEAEITEHTVLTAVVAIDGEPQAWFRNRIDDKLYKLCVGDYLQVGWFLGIVEAIEGHDVIVDADGERWLLTKGDRLADALALPPEY